MRASYGRLPGDEDMADLPRPQPAAAAWLTAAWIVVVLLAAAAVLLDLEGLRFALDFQPFLD